VRTLVASLLAVSVVGAGGATAARAASAPRCGPSIATIVCENLRPGTPPSEWATPPSGAPSIQGFTTDISVDHGQTVRFKIDTPSRRYHLDLYRLGYYAGMGARRVATVRPSVRLPQRQPPCRTQTAEHVRLTDCGNWAESAQWTVPRDATSGVYFARLVRDDVRGAASQVFFVVRDDEEHRSTLLFQTSDTTWQAYNDYGGRGVYTVPNTAKVSYNRPFTTRTAEGGHAVESWVLYSEYPMIRWLEANGYDVSYFTSVDSDRFGAKLRDHRVVLSVGHDEYWSAAQRANFVAARDAGVNLAFFSGNTSYWKTRWEPSIDGTATPYRTLVTYKESIFNAKTDPSPQWTGLWRDPRFSTPGDGGEPENAMTGTAYGNYDVPAIPMKVNGVEGHLRLWRNTSLARLGPRSVRTLAAQTVGYEWDWDLVNGARPPGTADFSSTPAVPFAHHVTLYRAPSGALVFSAGSVQWSWGLDGHHDGSWNGEQSPQPDVRMQQATVNVLADMGAQPGSRQRGLAAAAPSTDTTPPTATILDAPTRKMVAIGSTATVAGTALDTGGAVAGVEVSVDGGQTWRPATGDAQWSYSWVPTAPGTTRVEARAVDDSANLGAVAVGRGPTIVDRHCPCSLWDASMAPAVVDSGVPGPHELGVKFRADVDGFVNGVRFYKSRANTGPHRGSLWSDSGRRLSSVKFAHETASGWQTATFARPVPVTAGREYVASYHTDSGRYSQDPLYFDNWYASDTRGLDVPPLHAIWSRDADGPNGVMKAGASAFPTDDPPPNEYLDTANFWVDVLFTTETVAGRSAATARPTGTVEDRNAATLAANQSVEGSGTGAPGGGRSRRLLAALALLVLAVAGGAAFLLRGTVRRRRGRRRLAG
jgi:hypothetical protein